MTCHGSPRTPITQPSFNSRVSQISAVFPAWQGLQILCYVGIVDWQLIGNFVSENPTAAAFQRRHPDGRTQRE